MLTRSSQTAHRLNLFVVVLLAASLLALAPPPAHAATFLVDTTLDSNAAAYRACTEAPDDCSLRGAITKANAQAGADTITLPAGAYTLTITGSKEFNNAGGDLNVLSTLTINGAGAASTIIQAGTTSSNGIDSVIGIGNNSPATPGNLTLNGVTLRYGRGLDDYYGGGAAVIVGSLTANDSTIADNYSPDLGGAIWIGSTTVNLRNVVISNNRAPYGGGISSNGTLTATDCTFTNNHATIQGGGIHNKGNTTVMSSTFSGNSASAAGGGLYTAGSGVLTIENSTFSDNSADGDGGGMIVYAATDLKHVTVTDNLAQSEGGGIFRMAGALNLQNTIVAGNSATGIPATADCAGTTVSQGYNLVGAGTGCASGGPGDQTTSAPGLLALTDNGGPTQTHALEEDSPAVNAIPNGASGCGTDFTEDQRGKPRPNGAGCDVGAYELGPDRTWDNGGGDGKWSTPTNWSDDALPTAQHIAVFDATSAANATVDIPFTVAGVAVQAEYGGAILQGSSSLTVTYNLTQAGGTYTGGSGVLDIGGGFNQSGGTFTAPAGLMVVSGGFHHTGGTFDPNGGRVVLNNTTDQTLATTFNDLVLNDGLLGYWKLDEGSGTTAGDASGYGHDGALVNGAAWSAARPATMDFHDPAGLSFDGDNDYVDIPGTAGIDGLQQFTLAAWVELDTLPAGNMRFITLRNEKAVLRYDDQALDFFIKIDDSIRHFIVSSAFSASGAWRHVAGVYDGSAMRLYLEGAEQPGAVSVSGTVGAGAGIHLSSDGETLDGWLDDVRIYDRALSVAEISDLAQGKHPQTSVATTTLAAALDVNGDLTLNSGTLDVSTGNCASTACAINLAGDFTRNGGVFTAGAGAVTFDGSGAQILDTDALTFNTVTVNSGATLMTRRDFTASTLTNNGALQQTRNVVSGGVAFLWFGGYGGLSISGANLGDTTVTIRGNQDCTATADEPVRRCFDIAPTTPGGSARVQFYFAAGELAGNTCNTLNAYRWTGSIWQPLTLDTTWGGDGRACESEPYSVRVYPVTAFSPFALKSPAQPAAITDLTASDEDGVLRLDWGAVTQDLDGYGLAGATYDIYRAVDAPYATPETPYATGVTDTWFEDSGVIGVVAHNYTYYVRAAASGLASAASNRVGTCAFGLMPGSAQ